MNLPPSPDHTSLEDSALLRSYAETGAQDAFAELVRRRLGLVYSVALRQTGGDRHRAEDAAQLVFNDLARKARALAARPVLGGWLYRSAQLAAAELMRSEYRRQRREQEASFMDELTNDGARDEDWQKIRPLLDAALSEIDESDRDAIVLRFFDGRAFAEIGACLRLSENAARMRVQRALDRLNAALSRRGIRSSAAALGVALANQIGVAAPAGLAASVTGAALAQGAAAATGWLAALAGSGPLQLGLASAAVAVGAAAYGWQAHAAAEVRREQAGLIQQQQALGTLRAENRQLAALAVEGELLRRDDAELRQLAQKIDETRQAAAEKARLAREQEGTRAASAQFQAGLDRLNREGNALVVQYKSLRTAAGDPARPVAERAEATTAAQAKLAEIQAKQREVQAYIAAARVADPRLVASRAELRPAESVAGEVASRQAQRAAMDAAIGTAPEPARVALRLPGVDLATALAAFEQATGLRVIRDPSLAAVGGTLTYVEDPAAKPVVARGLGQALLEQLDVMLEPKGDGVVLAKRAVK